MFLVTFLMGYLPTQLKTSRKLMNLIAIFGAGLLVGAALIIIVPEGMMILFTSMINDSALSAHMLPPIIPLSNVTTVENNGTSVRLADMHGENSVVDHRVT